MKPIPQSAFVLIGSLALSLAQLNELPLGSSPTVAECVDQCRFDFFNTTGVTRDCKSAEWSCNCPYTDLWDHMACCMQDYCGDIDIESADDKYRSFCSGPGLEAEVPSLLECKDDGNGTTSSVPEPTGTITRDPTTSAESSEVSIPTTTTDGSRETSKNTEPTATGGRDQDEDESDSDNSGQSANIAMGVGLGVGIPVCAGGLGNVAFLLWRKRKARLNVVDSPASHSTERSVNLAGSKPPTAELESSNTFVHELPPESRRAELPG